MYNVKGFAFIVQTDGEKEVAIPLPLNSIKVKDYNEAHEKFASQNIKNYLFLLHKEPDEKEETE